MRHASQHHGPSSALLVALAGLLAGVLLLPALSQPGADASRTESMRLGLAVGARPLGMDPQQQADLLDDVVDLGLNWIRVDFDWSRLQPERDTPPDWSAVDTFVRQAAERDISVLPILAYTPAWARDPGCVSIHCPPARPAEFAAFAQAAAARYARQGVSTWEIWNEPNAAQFWPTPDAVRYAELLQLTRGGLRAADAGAKVVLGSLAATNGASHVDSIDPTTFLDRVCANVSCEGLAGIGYHPYTYPRLASDTRAPATSWQRISAAEPSLRTTLQRHDVKAPIWITEWGAPTGGPTTHAVSESLQAELITDGVQQAQNQPEIGALMVYTDRDLFDVEGTEGHYGLRRADNTPKAAWFALRKAATRP